MSNEDQTSEWPIDTRTADQINNAFLTPRLSTSTDQDARLETLRRLAKSLALECAKLTPPGRYRAMALTSVEDALIYAERAITRNPPG